MNTNDVEDTLQEIESENYFTIGADTEFSVDLKTLRTINEALPCYYFNYTIH